MPINEQIAKFSVQVGHTNVVPWDFVIRLTLASGQQATILFPKDPPTDFVTFSGGSTNVYLAESQYEHVYHLLQTESPVFFTALNLFGLQTAVLSTNPEDTGQGFLSSDTLAFVKSHSTEAERV